MPRTRQTVRRLPFGERFRIVLAPSSKHGQAESPVPRRLLSALVGQRSKNRIQD